MCFVSDLCETRSTCEVCENAVSLAMEMPQFSSFTITTANMVDLCYFGEIATDIMPDRNDAQPDYHNEPIASLIHHQEKNLVCSALDGERCLDAVRISRYCHSHTSSIVLFKHLLIP